MDDIFAFDGDKVNPRPVIFRIEEQFIDYSFPGPKVEYDYESYWKYVELAQPLPFDHILLQFEDCCIQFGRVDHERKSFYSGDWRTDEIIAIRIFRKEAGEIILSERCWINFNNLKIGPLDFIRGREYLNDMFLCAVSALVKFLNFLSCKNTRTREIHPSQKLQKKRQKAGKRLLLSYHVLELRPISGSVSHTMPQNIWTNRIHFCRGHIREYLKDAPLFGKHVGRFWVAPHVRGRSRNGIVMKDYRIMNKYL